MSCKTHDKAVQNMNKLLKTYVQRVDESETGDEQQSIMTYFGLTLVKGQPDETPSHLQKKAFNKRVKK